MPRTAYMTCECGFEEQDFLFKSYEQYVSKKDFTPCPDCGKLLIEKVGMPLHFVKEDNSPESVKPSSYWRNAEKNRLNNLKKSVGAEQEKAFYKDKEYVTKQERRASNQELQ